jgi:hypothetical protein
VVRNEYDVDIGPACIEIQTNSKGKKMRISSPIATTLSPAAIILSGAALAAPASAETYDCSATCAGDVGYGNTTAYITASGKQSQASIVKVGNYGAQARSECERANGGVAWYESTIRVSTKSGYSHYDCGNNGTYNVAIVANGVDFS